MNNGPDQNDRMIAEAFHGEWSEGASAKFALAAARAARRRMVRRRSVVGAAAALGMAAALAFAFRHLRLESNAPEVLEAFHSAEPARAYEIISDQELLAELKDRPLLAVQNRDGGTEFLLLEY